MPGIRARSPRLLSSLHAALDEARTERKLAESELRVAVENQKLAELEVQRAEELPGMRTIRSPVDGVVIQRHQKTGEFPTSNVKDRSRSLRRSIR